MLIKFIIETETENFAIQIFRGKSHSEYTRLMIDLYKLANNRSRKFVLFFRSFCKTKEKREIVEINSLSESISKDKFHGRNIETVEREWKGKSVDEDA